MNRPLDEQPDDLTDRLAGTYRAQREEPPVMLDDLILAKAKRAAEQRRVARLRALGASFAVAATLVLGLALSLQVITMPEPLAPPAERAESDVGEKMAEPVDRLLQRPAAAPVVTPAPRVVPAAPTLAPQLALPGAAPDAAATAPPPAAVPLEDAAAARARIAAELRAEPLDRLEVTGARAKRTQLEGADAVREAEERTDEQWLADIDRLVAEGRTAEAASALAGFCAAHPGHARCAKP